MESFKQILNNNNYHIQKNVISFIINDERPYWSNQVDSFYKNNKLLMGRMYSFNKLKYKEDFVMQSFYRYIQKQSGIIVDLASGLTGYFGPVIDNIKDNSCFVITDASKEIIKAHSIANLKRKNVVVCDIDLNNKLPFKDSSIDVYCGNLVNNVDEYKSLIKEISRTLKVNGKLVLIEWFFDSNSDTSEYLKQSNKITQSKEYFINYLNQSNLKLIKEELQNTRIEKLPGDLLPINENDKIYTWVLYFEKK